MRDILDGLLAWRAREEVFALATVVGTWASAPRPPGAAMAVSASGEVVGSISGGCIEGQTYEIAREVIANGRATLVRFGVTAEDAFTAGLTCGGVIEVFVEPIGIDQHSSFDAVFDAIQSQRSIVIATVTSGSGVGRHFILDRDGIAAASSGGVADGRLEPLMASMLATSATKVIELEGTSHSQGSTSVLIQSFSPPPRMIVFGAIDFAAAVAEVGRFLGYHVTVCDARAVFATPARFPRVDRLVVEWPHRYLRAQEIDDSAVLCVLTHDPKFDIPLLKVALDTPARYIGAMGNRRTHESRLAALRGEGVPEWQLDRLSSPIGLDLGGSTPEETAISIAAEIIAAGRGGSGLRLRDCQGAIHRQSDRARGNPPTDVPLGDLDAQTCVR